jgi:SAM-dependent methyltransferase
VNQPKFRDWKRYTTDEKWDRTYSDYQQRYRDQPRESDKKSSRMVVSAVRQLGLVRPPRILDIGCSTGNFLRHLKRVLPNAELTGGDLMEGHLSECRGDPTLAGITFETMNVLELPTTKYFDVIVANAVNVYFDAPDYQKAARSLAGAIVPGGFFVGFELIFPGNKTRTIIEPSDAHPEGLKVELRALDFVNSAFLEAGFHSLEYTPWEMPIDLPKPQATGTDAELISWTETDDLTGRRLLWRGIDPQTRWFQPWSHFITRRDTITRHQ